ncbi:MAG: RNA polymerase sigma factor [Gemmatimonadales bacterium]
MNEADERRLVHAIIARRDDRAFRVLYDRHTRYLYRLALRLAGGDEREAEEITHDAWVGAIERLATFAWRSAFRTWVAGFVVNRAREATRHDARLEPLAETPGEDVALVSLPNRIDLERAVARLPPRQRHVFVLHDAEGWTHEAIAEHLGIDPGTSKSQLSRARAALRGWLDEGTP